MDATLILRDKQTLPSGVIIERVVWQLPAPEPRRSHGLKYRLFCGLGGMCLVRYDNEAGKGDHRHYGEQEEPYEFVSLERLLIDFAADVRRMAEVKDGQ